MVGQRILVTGGAGSIGSALCVKLLVRGFSVVCLDLPGRVLPPVLERLRGEEGFRYVARDAAEPFDVPCDAVYALAAPTDKRRMRDHPLQTLRELVRCAVNTLEVAVRNNAPAVFASSAAVYGNTRSPIQSETDFGRVDTFGPRSALEEGTRAAEALCAAYGRQYGADIRVARIFDAYGDYASADDRRAIPGFVRRALQGRDLAVEGDGRQTRTFCHVDDIAEGLMGLMGLEKGAAGGPVNLGHDYRIPIRTLAEKIIMLCGSRSRIIHVPAPPDEILDRCPDLTRIRQLTGWQPRIPLDAGLRRCIEAFRSDPADSDRRYAAQAATV